MHPPLQMRQPRRARHPASQAAGLGLPMGSSAVPNVRKLRPMMPKALCWPGTWRPRRQPVRSRGCLPQRRTPATGTALNGRSKNLGAGGCMRMCRSQETGRDRTRCSRLSREVTPPAMTLRGVRCSTAVQMPVRGPRLLQWAQRPKPMRPIPLCLIRRSGICFREWTLHPLRSSLCSLRWRKTWRQQKYCASSTVRRGSSRSRVGRMLPRLTQGSAASSCGSCVTRRRTKRRRTQPRRHSARAAQTRQRWRTP
mmetsp:Transcript_15595/g.37060  ORF Transcript_15595/g.37060 Transcript_15595/m.37060 type:complete len:253 (-) Transcript_15595:1277-2035(-)